jgi:hypothetical protein
MDGHARPLSSKVSPEVNAPTYNTSQLVEPGKLALEEPAPNIDPALGSPSKPVKRFLT